MNFSSIDTLLENSTNVAPAIVCKVKHKGKIVYEKAVGNNVLMSYSL